MEKRPFEGFPNESIDFDPANPESVELIVQALGEAVKGKIMNELREEAEKSKNREERSDWFRNIVLDKVARFFPVQIGSLGSRGPLLGLEKLPRAGEVLEQIVVNYREQQEKKD